MLFHEDSAWDVPVEIHVLNESIFKNKATISVRKTEHATKHLLGLNVDSESGVKTNKLKSKKLKRKLFKQQQQTVEAKIDNLSPTPLPCKSHEANFNTHSTQQKHVGHSSTEQQRKRNRKNVKCSDSAKPPGDHKQKLVADMTAEKAVKVHTGSFKTKNKDGLISGDKKSKQIEQFVEQQLDTKNVQQVAKRRKFSRSSDDVLCVTMADSDCRSTEDSLPRPKKQRKNSKNEKKMLKRKLEISDCAAPQLKKKKISTELTSEKQKHSAAIATNKQNVTGSAVKSSGNSSSAGKHFNIGRLRTVLNSSRAAETVKDSQKSVKSAGTRFDAKQKNVTDVGLVDRLQRTQTREGSVSNVHDSSSLKDRMMDRLAAARFRYINEQLYNSTGSDAADMFAQDNDAFVVYHTGFQSQVEKWPMNPVDKMIDYIRKSENAVIADFGCGDAKIAQSVRNKVHSFDLVALNERVIACDMAHVPLKSSSVDIAVFCLSLMGTNLLQYLCEAHRILKQGGTLLIAEVVSRFDKIGGFIRKLQKLGFTLQHKDVDNTMFVWFELKKTASLPSDDRLPTIELLPCIYKKR